MADLFPKTNTYDNEGNLNVNSSSAFMKAKLTTQSAGAGTPGAISNVYDLNSATECLILNTTGTGYLQWQFLQKPLFRTLIATYRIDVGGNSADILLEGSNDGSAWTTIASRTPSVDETYSLVGTDVNYNYIRFSAVAAAASVAVWLSDIMGVTA